MPHKALRLLSAAPALFARQGSVVATWRYCRERKIGPCYRLVYREEGKQRSVYLGRFGTLVRQVRGWRTCPIRWALNLPRPFRCVSLGPQPYFPTLSFPAISTLLDGSKGKTAK